MRGHHQLAIRKTRTCTGHNTCYTPKPLPPPTVQIEVRMSVTVARTRRQNALDASTAPLYYYHDRVQHRYTRPPLRPSRPDLRPHRDSNQRPPTHGPPCRTHGQEFWTLTGLELATCGSVPKTHATSRPLHYCVANLAPNQDVTVARTRRQNALDASTAPLYYYHDRVQHRYNVQTELRTWGQYA